MLCDKNGSLFGDIKKKSTLLTFNIVVSLTIISYEYTSMWQDGAFL